MGCVGEEERRAEVEHDMLTVEMEASGSREPATGLMGCSEMEEDDCWVCRSAHP